MQPGIGKRPDKGRNKKLKVDSLVLLWEDGICVHVLFDSRGWMHVIWSLCAQHECNRGSCPVLQCPLYRISICWATSDCRAREQRGQIKVALRPLSALDFFTGRNMSRRPFIVQEGVYPRVEWTRPHSYSEIHSLLTPLPPSG